MEPLDLVCRAAGLCLCLCLCLHGAVLELGSWKLCPCYCHLFLCFVGLQIHVKKNSEWSAFNILWEWNILILTNANVYKTSLSCNLVSKWWQWWKKICFHSENVAKKRTLNLIQVYNICLRGFLCIGYLQAQLILFVWEQIIPSETPANPR